MANAFAPGTGGTLTETTLEAAFGELCEAARALDAALETPTGNITIIPSVNPAQATYAITLPYTSALVNGNPTQTATDFIGTAFAPGTGGDLDASTVDYPSAILELAYLMKAEEDSLGLDVIDISSDETNISIGIVLSGTVSVTVTDTYLA